MYVVVVAGNKNGKVELTKEELQSMLDEAYQKGRMDERSRGYYVYTSPNITWDNKDYKIYCYGTDSDCITKCTI